MSVGPASRCTKAQAPRQALAEIQVIAVMQHGAGQQFAFTSLLAPTQARGQAAMAGLARRVLHGAAVLADLQLEASLGGGRRDAERDASACRRRQVHLPRAQHRILACRTDQRLCHAGLPRIIAPVHRQRSYVTMPNPATSPSRASPTRASLCLVGELADRLGHAEKPGRRARLAGRELPAAGVVGGSCRRA